MSKTYALLRRFWRDLDRGFCTLTRIQWSAPWNTRATRC